MYYPEFDQRISDEVRARNDGVANGLDAESVDSLFTKVSYGAWSLAGFFIDRNKQVPTASFDTIFNDPREETRDRRAYLEISHDRRIGEEVELQARVFVDDYLYRGAYPYDPAEPGDPADRAMYRDAAIGKWFGPEWQFSAQLAGHALQMGGEYRDNRREYQDAYYDLEPRSYDLQDERSRDALGLYVQDEVRLPDKVVLTAGLRFDRYFDNFGSTSIARMGLIYSPSPTATLKALYGQAYRAPNPFERFYNPEQVNQPELNPETIKTYELVYERYFGHRYRVGAAAYYYDVNELITQTQTEVGDLYFANLDEVRANGIELEAEGRFDSGVRLSASYTLQKAKDDVSGLELSSSPRHLGKLHVSVPTYREVLASVQLQYNGASRTIRGARGNNFLTANLTLLSQNVVRGLELSAGRLQPVRRAVCLSGLGRQRAGRDRAEWTHGARQTHVPVLTADDRANPPLNGRCVLRRRDVRQRCGRAAPGRRRVADQVRLPLQLHAVRGMAGCGAARAGAADRHRRARRAGARAGAWGDRRGPQRQRSLDRSAGSAHPGRGSRDPAAVRHCR